MQAGHKGRRLAADSAEAGLDAEPAAQAGAQSHESHRLSGVGTVETQLGSKARQHIPAVDRGRSRQAAAGEGSLLDGRLEIAGLTTRIVEPPSGEISSTVVLLHGFGAPGDDLVGLAPYLHAPRTRFVFPAAPLELGGLYGDSRAWWLLDLARLEASLATGSIHSWIAEVPEGLDNARAVMLRFLETYDVETAYCDLSAWPVTARAEPQGE